MVEVVQEDIQEMVVMVDIVDSMLVVFFKIFKGSDWKGNAGLAAMMFPGVMFGVFTFLNFFIWMQKSSGAIPFGTFFILVFLWFGISDWDWLMLTWLTLTLSRLACELASS